MSKKDYIKFARMYSNMLKELATGSMAQLSVVNVLIKDTESIFKADNPNFDSARFENEIYKENK
jgi:hypothetical protein